MEFQVNCAVASAATTNIYRCEKELESIRSAVAKVKRNCAVTGNNGVQLTRAMDTVMKALENEKKGADSMRTALTDIVEIYKKYEQKIIDNTDQITFEEGKAGGKTDKLNPASSDGAETSSDSSERWKYSWSDFWKDLIKAIGSVGIAGNLIAAVSSWLTGNGSFADLITVCKYIAKAVGSGAAAVSEGGAWAAWSDSIVGATATETGAKSFGKAFSEAWEKQFPTDMTKGSSAVKTVAKWAGYVLTVVQNAYENVQEYAKDGISVGRAISETIIESAVDIGVGAAASAGVTAVLTAIGVAAPPALVVGIGAVILTTGANAICKWATNGRDLGEVAADFVCNMGEAYANWRDQTAQKISQKIFGSVFSGISRVGNIVTGWSKAVFAS